jgi:hypothetical protein
MGTPTHPRTSKKHGKGQADGGGYIFHRRKFRTDCLGRTGKMGTSAIAKEMGIRTGECLSGGYLTLISPFISHTHRRFLGGFLLLSRDKDISNVGSWDCNCYQYPDPTVVDEKHDSKSYTEITYSLLGYKFCQTKIEIGLVLRNPPIPNNQHIHRVFRFSQNPHRRCLHPHLYQSSSTQQNWEMRTSRRM